MRTIFANTAFAIASVGITALAVAASAPAVAATVDSVPSVVVQTADLNLSTPAGHDTAMQRIGSAANRVCDTGGNDLSMAACRSKAMADATQSLDALTAPAEIATR